VTDTSYTDSSIPPFDRTSLTLPALFQRVRPFAASAVIATMSVIACLGYSGVFVRWTYLIPVVAAVVGASAVALVARQRSWFVGESLLVSTLFFFIVGTIVTQWLPGLSSPIDFASALANGWADLLSSQPPVDLQRDLAVVPFTTAWVTTALAQELDRRVNFFGIAVVGVLVGLVGTSLFSIEVRSLAVVQGPLLIGLTLVLALMQRRRSETASGVSLSRSSAASSAATIRAAAMLLLIGVIAATIGPRLPLADARERFDLRDFQENPFDPLEEPSPLVTLKAKLKEGARDDVLFAVTTDTPITRWTLAVMESYDGVVWEVADPTMDAPAQFVPVGSQLPSYDAPYPSATDDRFDVEIEIVNLTGPWVPHTGRPRVVGFDDAREVRLNVDTATVATPNGLTEGDRYSLQTELHPQLTPDEFDRANFAFDADATRLDRVPAPVLNLAAELVEGVDFGGSQVTAIQNLLVTEGFYDAGQARPPGHSYAQLISFLEDPTRIVGYEEQYAASAAVLARAAAIPTRVVVGFRIEEGRYRDGTAEIVGSDATAWVEVLINDVGWVPVDVSPDRSREPTDESLGRVTRNIAVPNVPPPPPPPIDTAPLDPDEEEELVDEEDTEDEELLGEERSLVSVLLDRPGLVAGTVAISPFILFGLLALLAAFLKLRRARKRRNAPTPELQIVGAWAEMIDRFQEAGHQMPPNAAPLEIAEGILLDDAVAPAEPAIRDLVSLVSQSAFAATPPTAADVDHAWECAQTAGDVATSELETFERLKVKADPRPLLRSTPGPQQ